VLGVGLGVGVGVGDGATDVEADVVGAKDADEEAVLLLAMLDEVVVEGVGRSATSIA